ncbi:MAG TPA: Maf family protein [Bryobacteraceae bacterium]|nr:Maf family protein [Bryobacteraceae bacterium]
MKLVLASRSPRRAELLQAAGLSFIVRSAEIDETPREGENPEDYVLRLAEEKACAVLCKPEEIILAADTCVVLDGAILGKPIDAPDAARMVESLAGRRHEVLTGVCLRSGNRFERQCASTSVWFSPMSPEEIAEYVASGEPMDKAGAYGIQGLASRYIERVEGSYTNVVGLPVAMVYRMVAAFGDFPAK